MGHKSSQLVGKFGNQVFPYIFAIPERPTLPEQKLIETSGQMSELDECLLYISNICTIAKLNKYNQFLKCTNVHSHYI